MKKLLSLIAVFVFLLVAGGVSAQGSPDKAGAAPVKADLLSDQSKADAAPALPSYKTRIELYSEIKRLEALAPSETGHSPSKTRHSLSETGHSSSKTAHSAARTWQEDFALAVAYMHARRPGEARPLIEKTIRVRPSFLKAYESLGMALFKLGDMKEAAVAWERAIKLNPGAVHLNQMITLARGKIELAAQIDELLLELDVALGGKEQWKRHMELSRLYLKLRDSGRSLDHMKKAISIKGGGDIIFLEKLGRAYAAMGSFTEAGWVFNKALTLAQDSPADQRRLRGMVADMEVLGAWGAPVKKIKDK